MNYESDRFFTAISLLYPGENDTALAKRWKESRQTISNWRVRGIPDHAKVKIALENNVSLRWLCLGEGPMINALWPFTMFDYSQFMSLPNDERINLEQLTAGKILWSQQRKSA